MKKDNIKETILTILKFEKQQETNQFLLSFISHLISTLNSYKDNPLKQRDNIININNIFSHLEYS